MPTQLPYVSASEYKGKVDFAILTIKIEERDAVLERFVPHVVARGQHHYNICTVDADDSHQYTCAVVRSLYQGNQHALSTTSNLIADLEPRWILVVGIAGGAPSDDFTLGDVILSNFIYDFSVRAQRADGSVEFDTRGGYVHPEIASLLANLRPGLLPGWNESASIGTQQPAVDLQNIGFDPGVDTEWQKKVHKSLAHHFGSNVGSQRSPRFLVAAIASSDALVRDPALVRSWHQFARRIEAVEMETAGAYTAAQQRNPIYPVLAIRGISDIVGLTRSGNWTEYSCHTAAAFALAFVKSSPIPAQAQPAPSQVPNSVPTVLPTSSMQPSPG